MPIDKNITLSIQIKVLIFFIGISFTYVLKLFEKAVNHNVLKKCIPLWNRLF